MCDDCHEETALEAEKRYQTRGAYDRETDPATAGYHMLSQANRYRAEVAMGAYYAAGYPLHQIQAVEELTAAIVDDDFLWGTVSESYALKHEDEALNLFKSGHLKYPPRNWPSTPLRIETRLEYWSVVMRLTQGFLVKTDAQYALDVAEREAEEADAEAARLAARTTRKVVIDTWPGGPAPRLAQYREDGGLFQVAFSDPPKQQTRRISEVETGRISYAHLLDEMEPA